MRVFLSWSGELSHRVAQALNDFLPSMIQSVTTWISSADIESGTRWSDVLFRELEDDSFGIACVTKQNPSSPWINFESGAIAKQVTKARVVPLLFDMQSSDLPANHPFTQFNYIIYREGRNNQETMFKLLRDINLANDIRLTDVQLTNSFEAFWPRLDERLSNLAREAPSILGQAVQERPLDTAAVLNELLQLNRDQSRILAGFGQYRTEEQVFVTWLADVLRSPDLKPEEQLALIRRQMVRIDPTLLKASGRNSPPPTNYRTIQTDQLVLQRDFVHALSWSCNRRRRRRRWERAAA
jgi:hypothetical protein